MWRHRQRTIDQVEDDTAGIAMAGAEHGHGRARHGGAGASGNLATFISAVALLFSGYSFYESVLKAPDVAVYAPPRIEYTDPDRPDSPYEVFIIPLTIANSGARSATVLSIDLEVKNRNNGDVKTFYASQQGIWGLEPRKPFAPVVLEGRQAFSETVQFMPRTGEKVARILDLEPGVYDFKVTLNTGSIDLPWPFGIAPVKPLTFARKKRQTDYRWFTRTGTMTMWAPDHQPAAN